MKITKQRLKEIIIEELSEATKRDYKAEYKKYGSSTKAKKYRAELNKYNRQKGTYGNGDKKDASHKGGKIVGFEEQSKNRGRAEKSRLKKEGKISFSKDEMAKLHKDGSIKKDGNTYFYKEGKITERSAPKLRRWKIYIDGERQPFIVSGKDQRAAKKIAHAMTYPAKIKIKKIVKEGGPGSGPNGEDNPFDREPSDDELTDIEKEYESIEEAWDTERQSWSSKEAKKVMDNSLRNYAKDLRKVEGRVIKDWMTKAKAGVLDFFDIERGLTLGDASRAHPEETQFLHDILVKDKILNRFRSYFGGKKGKPRGRGW